jgi:hypothetical protein
LDIVVPRALELLHRLGLRITFFIVGQDAALERNAKALRSIADAGHEIGNHSFNHEPWLQHYDREGVRRELVSAGDAITAATGMRPRGFRGPGFSLSRSTLELLAELDYTYDATTFPTYIGPLARAYYFMTAKLSSEELEKRRALFGSVRDGLRPLRAYRWKLDHTSLTEIPVTTFPGMKIPIHFSYILYLATLAPPLALPYFRTALTACRLSGLQPSLLLHPLDFMGCDDVASLAFFPAMNRRADQKLPILESSLRALRDTFGEVIPVGEHAERAARSPKLKERIPDFS